MSNPHEHQRSEPMSSPFYGDTPTSSDALRSVPTIPEFFRGRNVFVTGGSGFMGKVLLEKLLRSCPDVGNIYVLLRAKKGKDVSERLEEIVRTPLFDRLREEIPTAFKKLVPISGDVCELKLGMSSEDRSILQETVSVVFHSAASVRFDDPLKKAVIINVRGTREVIHLALGMKLLKAFVHVSTAYSNCDQAIVGEKMYPPHGDWKAMIRLAEDQRLDQSLCLLAPKILSYLPNTYIYAKSLAEHLVKDFEHQLPVVLFRPSIVVSTKKEPMPGWLENFNGPVGLMAAGGIGIMWTFYGDPSYKADYVAVDTSINAIIVSAWQRAVHSAPPAMPIYNCTSMIKAVNLKEFVALSKTVHKERPFPNAVWYSNSSVTGIKAVYFIKVLLLHMLPALIIDGGLMLMGRKTMLTKLQKIVYVANISLAKFMFQKLSFENHNFLDLHNRLLTEDVESFGMQFIEDIISFMNDGVVGAHLYLLHQSLDELPRAKARQRWLYWLDRITKVCLFSLFLFWTSPFIKRHLNVSSSWSTISASLF